jgi:hypothetical protein
MDATALVRAPGATISMDAEGGLELGRIDSSLPGQPSATGGLVQLRAEGVNARIVSARDASGLNVQAGMLRMQGYGLRLGDDGRALRVDAGSLDLWAPGGVLSRQTQAGGHTHHVAMVGDTLYLQVASLGTDTVASGAFVPHPPQSNPVLKTLSAAPSSGRGQVSGVDQSVWAARATDTPATEKMMPRLPGVDGTRPADLISLHLDDDEPPAGDSLSRAFLLGSVFSQPSLAGLAAADMGVAEYWIDNLYL